MVNPSSKNDCLGPVAESGEAHESSFTVTTKPWMHCLFLRSQCRSGSGPNSHAGETHHWVKRPLGPRCAKHTPCSDDGKRRTLFPARQGPGPRGGNSHGKNFQRLEFIVKFDRVGVTGLRPSPLPHHRTSGFLASSGWRRWTSPECVHNVCGCGSHHSSLSFTTFRLRRPRRLRSVPHVGIHRPVPLPRPSPDDLSGNFRDGPESGCQPVSCAFGPSLQPLSRPSSLLRPLLTSARLSTGRSPRVRCMDCRAGPSDSTPRAFR